MSVPVLKFDLKFINSILKLHFSPDKLENCVMASRIAHVFERMDISCETMFADFFEGEDFQIYLLLKGPEYDRRISYKESEKLKRKSIEQYVSICNLEMFKRIIDVCKDIPEFDGSESYKIEKGLGIAFDAISCKKELYIGAIQYYLKKDTPCNLHPHRLMSTLFSLLSDEEVYRIVNAEEYKQKYYWLYAFYHELPPERITENHLQNLYGFLEDTSDRDITTAFMRDVDFLGKYNRLDDQAFIKGCKIILAKTKYSRSIFFIYFNLLFNIFHNTPQEVITKFNCDLELLEDIYFAMLLYDHHTDSDGQFLKELFLINTYILDKYISHLAESFSSFSAHQERLRCFFELDNFIEIYDKVFEQLLNLCRFAETSVPYLLESLLLPTQNEKKLLERQDEWIRHCIQRFSKDQTKMYCLFSVISNLEIDRKTEYVLRFLENNPLFEDFEWLPLIPTSYSWTGSAVPVYSEWIKFLESLLSNLIGLKWLKHKEHVEKRIHALKKQIESIEIDEILRG